MGATPYAERRDPISPLLRLGAVLCRAQKEGQSGHIAVRDQGKVHEIRLAGGAIAGICWEGERSMHNPVSKTCLHRQTERLFSLQRPDVTWHSSSIEEGIAGMVHPHPAVVAGIVGREDLFDPKSLALRIPVEVLQMDDTQIAGARRLALTPAEMAFVERLRIPTPVPLILWKRGLAPSHAAALLVALNLIGMWEGTWRSGDLPRLTIALETVRRINRGCLDYETLGVSKTASIRDIDQAFRRLSFEVHPDRHHGLSDAEKQLAHVAFLGVNAAFSRLKKSHFPRPILRAQNYTAVPVGIETKPRENWADLMAEAGAAKRTGQTNKAKVFFVKALAESPPEAIRDKIIFSLKNMF